MRTDDLSPPPSDLWPSVVCDLCAWRFSGWSRDSAQLLALFRRQWIAHLRAAHPADAEAQLAAAHRLNERQP